MAGFVGDDEAGNDNGGAKIWGLDRQELIVLVWLFAGGQVLLALAFHFLAWDAGFYWDMGEWPWVGRLLLMAAHMIAAGCTLALWGNLVLKKAPF